MIEKTYRCRRCGSSDLVKNGHNASGSQQYHCKACGAYLVLEPSKGYSDEEKEKILSATLLPAEEGDVLELDEAWSFVRRKKNKQWLCAEISATAMCRRTRQIVAFVIGDRSARTCATQKFLLFWAKIPDGYKACQSFSDFWKAYVQVFSTETHEQVEKGTARPRT